MEFLSLCGGGKKPFGDSGDTLAACFLCSSIIRYSCLNLVVALGMCMVSFPDPWYGTGISCTKGLRLRLVLAPSLRAISHSYGFVLQGRILYRWGLAKTGKGQLVQVIVTETKVFDWQQLWLVTYYPLLKLLVYNSLENEMVSKPWHY